MDTERILTNARMVLKDEVVTGSCRIKNGRIRSLDSGPTRYKLGTNFVDLHHDYLLPGLIEIHTDHLESQFQPRPGVLWPSSLAALTAHDAQVVAAGITTVLNGVCCGQVQDGKMRHKLLGLSLEALTNAKQEQILRADHYLHLRCEICDPTILEIVRPHLENPWIKLVSLMDHTPGQRQFADPMKYRRYYGHMNWSDQEFESAVKAMQGTQGRLAGDQRKALLEMLRQRQIPMASHDDTLAEHVREAASEGMVISEFPTSLEAAATANELGLKTVYGAPNVVQGASHSGNVSALEVAEQGFLDMLSSDYVPGSLLHGAFVLNQRLGFSLPKAMRTVTATPASLLDLSDRGVLEPDKRADLLRVREIGQLPVVQSVWVKGTLVFTNNRQ